jgi:hypothetical protein
LKNLNFELLLKSIFMDNTENKNFNLFTEYPLKQLENSNGIIFKLKIDKWYHNFFRKQRIKLIKYYLKSRNKCTCICHIIPGFYHCWDKSCCDKENLNWRK